MLDRRWWQWPFMAAVHATLFCTRFCSKKIYNFVYVESYIIFVPKHQYFFCWHLYFFLSDLYFLSWHHYLFLLYRSSHYNRAKPRVSFVARTTTFFVDTHTYFCWSGARIIVVLNHAPLLFLARTITFFGTPLLILSISELVYEPYKHAYSISRAADSK